LFAKQLQKNNGIDPIKKEAFKLLEAFCIFGYREIYKNYFASWSSCIKECMEKNHRSKHKF
jgi:hypothetical protein